MKNEELKQDDLNNLEELHEYSVQLKNTLNELSNELNDGTLSWKELTQKGNTELTQQVSSITQDSFENIEGTFDNYTGLIYDGAFSEHMTSFERKGLTGNDVDEETAKNIAEEFVGKDKISETNSNGLSENGNIPSYSFNIKTKDEDEMISIAISQRGGHLVYMDTDRNVGEEIITQDEANEKAIEFLKSRGYSNMEKTYYLKEDGMVTINYAYKQDGVICYPDLIKVKVALDDGDITGLETTGYLNCHIDREFSDNIIDSDSAMEKINKNLEITNIRLALIPTEYQTEIYCWEFQGKVNDNEFLVYINAETGEEEDIQIIVNTPNGTLTT
jgi:germination protein YpeB